MKRLILTPEEKKQRRHAQQMAAKLKMRTPTYYTWMSVRMRCLNPNTNRYYLYGGRGIKVCERWRDSFKNFLSDMGERPPGTTLRRIDADGHYEPSNCRWETPAQQQRNTRRNIWIEHNGERKVLQDWATELGISRATIKRRLALGVPITG